MILPLHLFSLLVNVQSSLTLTIDQATWKSIQVIFSIEDIFVWWLIYEQQKILRYLTTHTSSLQVDVHSCLTFDPITSKSKGVI